MSNLREKIAEIIWADWTVAGKGKMWEELTALEKAPWLKTAGASIQSLNLVQLGSLGELEKKLQELLCRHCNGISGADPCELDKDTCPVLRDAPRQIHQLYREAGYVQLDEDQSLPDNEAWHKDPREFEAYCAGRNELIYANFKKMKE